MTTLNSNRDFVLAVLHAIATTPALRPLADSLVLKGGIALLVHWGSQRVSRKDIDFGLITKNYQLSQRDSDTLLAALDEWGAVAKNGNRSIARKGDGIDTPVIEYTHPVTGERGELTLQVNASQVPPILLDDILAQDPIALTTHKGQKFSFKALMLEEIAGEKICRLMRPDKMPPRLVDLYDIGFCAKQPEFDETKLACVVREHKKERSEGRLIKVDQMLPVVGKLLKDGDGAQKIMARRQAFFGPGVNDAQISALAKDGLDILKRAVGK